MREYELPCEGTDTSAFVERELIGPLTDLGYVIDARGERSVTLLALRRPRWAVAFAVFLFPVGLVLLLVKRSREARLAWRPGSATLELSSDDRAVRHLASSLAVEHDCEPSLFDKAAGPFVAGALPVLIVWLASVQFVESAPAFGATIFFAILIGAGAGTLIGLRRTSQWKDPPSAFTWGTVPALAGAATTTVAFVALVALLVALGAGD